MFMLGVTEDLFEFEEDEEEDEDEDDGFNTDLWELDFDDEPPETIYISRLLRFAFQVTD